MSTDCPLNWNAVFRAVTESAETFDISVVMSSLMPSLKYSCSASPLMLTNGSTQTDGPLRRIGERAALALAVSPARAAMLDSTLRQPGAWTSPRQPLRSAHWIWLNGIGSADPSSDAWTKVPVARA